MRQNCLQRRNPWKFAPNAYAIIAAIRRTMKHRILYALGLSVFGLMSGILLAGLFLPESGGALATALPVSLGIVVGATLTWAILTGRARKEGEGRADVQPTDMTGSANSTTGDLGYAPIAARAATVSEPSAWRMQIGGSRVAVRYNRNWWADTQAQWNAGIDARMGSDTRRWVAVACLIGAVGLAMYGQIQFSKLPGGPEGYYAYLLAVVFWIGLLILAGMPADATERRADAKVGETAKVRPWQIGMIGAALVGGIATAYVGATTPWNRPQNANIALWVVVCLLYAAAFVPWGRLRAWLQKRDWAWLATLKERAWANRLEIGLVLGIVVVGFVLRYWRVAFIPGIFGGDEGEMGNEALNILRGELKNPFFLDVIAPTVYALRLLSVVGGTLAILVSYLLVRRMFSVRLALITAALLAVYNFHIHYSRLALNNIFDSLFAPLVLLLLYAGIESRKPGYFAAAGMAMGASIYFYHGARFIPVLVAVFVLYLVVRTGRAVFRDWLNYVWLAVGSLIVAGPLLYFFYLHPQDFMARLSQRGIFQSGWFEREVEGGRAASEVLLEQVRRSFMAFNQLPDPTGWFGTGLPLLDPLSGMLLVFGLVVALAQFGKKNYALMVLWLILGVLFGSTLLENPPTSPSFVMVVVPLLFLVALGLDSLVQVGGRLLRPLKRVGWAVAAVFVALFALWNVSYYFIEYSPKLSYGGEPNLVARELVNLVEKRTDKYRVYFVAPPYIYLGIGSRRFMMPNLNGVDVLEPIASAADLDFVRKNRTALFVFVPARVDELDVVRQIFPNGTVQRINKPDGNLLFVLYEVPM